VSLPTLSFLYFAPTALTLKSSPQTESDTATYLQQALQNVYNILKQIIANQLDQIASAQSPQAQQNLTALVQSGFLTTNVNMEGNNTAQLTSQALAMLYGNIIPAAWAISSSKLRPFIL